MLSQNNLEIVKKTVEEFFSKMSFEATVNMLGQESQTLLLAIEAEEPQILIGERGETLWEIQHLLKLILRKKIEPSEQQFYIDLDINDYKKKKIEYLKETAKIAADEVALSKTEKVLPLMSSYERRIIHLELAERSDVISESVGEEPERRIVIRPKP